jgi:hypothetical protein
MLTVSCMGPCSSFNLQQGMQPLLRTREKLSDSRGSFILLLNLLSMASDAIAQWTKEDKSRKTIVEENWGPRILHLLVFVSVRCSIWLCCAWHCAYRVYLVVYDYMSNISRSLYDCNSILLYLFTWGENLAQVSVIAIYAILEAQLMYYNQVSVICFMLYNIYTLEINGQKIMWIGLLCSCIGPSAVESLVSGL